MSNLGDLKKEMGNLLKAEQFYLKSLRVYQNLFGENNSDVALSCKFLGKFYENMGNLAKAEEFYLRSKAIWRKIHSVDI